MSDTVTCLPNAAPAVVFTRVREGAVLLSTEDEVYYGLNEVGAAIWESLDREETLDGLCARLEERYPGVEPERIREDAEDLIRRLSDLGLVAPGDTERSRDAPA